MADLHPMTVVAMRGAVRSVEHLATTEERTAQLTKDVDDVTKYATFLRAYAELVDQGSTKEAFLARVAKSEDTARASRGESTLASGITLKSKGGHIAALTRKIETANLTGELERLRRARESAREDLAKAKGELARRGGMATPAERGGLESEVGIRQGLLDAAAAGVVEAEGALARLQGAGA